MANATRPKWPQPAHACPGRCGQQVPYRLLACQPCWWLLPKLQRDEIRRLSGLDRTRAVGEALIWFRENVDGGVFIGDA